MDPGRPRSHDDYLRTLIVEPLEKIKQDLKILQIEATKALQNLHQDEIGVTRAHLKRIVRASGSIGNMIKRLERADKT